MIALGFASTFFFLPLVTSIFPPQVPSVRTCGTVITRGDINRVENRFKEFQLSSSFAVSNTTANVTIQVAFHVISEDNSLEGGNIPDEQVTASIDVLNVDYASSGVSFALVNITRTLNSAWFKSVSPNSPEGTEAKTSLRVGDFKTLNIYTVGFTDGTSPKLLGYSAYPWYADALAMDGVVILYSTVPGGTTANYNRGRTLTHEVGHWVGLYHTFEGGCDGGDQVSDTAPEASPAYGCPIGRDTCTNDTLPDPITNFMDYTYDACMNQFTPGQIARFRQQISLYRNL